MSQSERRKATSEDIILELEDAYTKDPGKNVGPLAEATSTSVAQRMLFVF